MQTTIYVLYVDLKQVVLQSMKDVNVLTVVFKMKRTNS